MSRVILAGVSVGAWRVTLPPLPAKYLVKFHVMALLPSRRGPSQPGLRPDVFRPHGQRVACIVSLVDGSGGDAGGSIV